MPTELKNETGNLIRERAHEYGATTGRPRRCGWFDAVAARFSSRINGFTDMALTRLDVLGSFPRLKICTGYELDGNTIDYFPGSVASLDRCRPVYEELPGWRASISHIREYEQLPPEARHYIERLEEITGCPASLISVGAQREETIHRTPLT
jgi:adenylosuccinate synthase